MECKERALYFTKRLKLSPKNLVLEIGSNNGCQLQFFKKLGMKILGIEPAQNAAGIANRKGVLTITEFLS
jgi:protein-L-isoaspartate O-methyltransferase